MLYYFLLTILEYLFIKFIDFTVKLIPSFVSWVPNSHYSPYLNEFSIVPIYNQMNLSYFDVQFFILMY